MISLLRMEGWGSEKKCGLKTKQKEWATIGDLERVIHKSPKKTVLQFQVIVKEMVIVNDQQSRQKH